MLAAFEERSDANKTNVIIPEYSVQLLVSWYLEFILENYMGISRLKPQNEGTPTFEALPSSLIEETFLLTVVGDMTGIFSYIPQWGNNKSFDLRPGLRLLVRKGRIVDGTLGLSFRKNRAILSHLVWLFPHAH